MLPNDGVDAAGLACSPARITAGDGRRGDGWSWRDWGLIGWRRTWRPCACSWCLIAGDVSQGGGGWSWCARGLIGWRRNWSPCACPWCLIAGDVSQGLVWLWRRIVGKVDCLPTLVRGPSSEALCEPPVWPPCARARVGAICGRSPLSYQAGACAHDRPRRVRSTIGARRNQGESPCRRQRIGHLRSLRTESDATPTSSQEAC